MEKVILFGASGGGKRLFKEISNSYEIVAFTDNDELKWNKKICDTIILSPEECLKKEFDFWVITIKTI